MFKNLKGKRALLRVDFNVPLKNGKVVDDFRIRIIIPTIKDLFKKGVQVFVITHLESDGAILHLDAVRKKLENLLGAKVGFVRGKVPAHPRKFKEKVVMFDNIRLNPGEEKNDPAFAKQLARWGDFYINDAFPVSHRSHTSIVGLPKLLPSFLGLQMEREIKNLSRAFNPPRPFLFILGGKKFSTKEPLVAKFLTKADWVFVGGALGNTFLARRGFPVGKSGVEPVSIPRNIIWNKKIILAKDAYVLRNGKKVKTAIGSVKPNDIIDDAGPQTVKMLKDLSRRSKFILWNGPLGVYEKGFYAGTKNLAKSFHGIRAFRLLGGGDTIAAIRKFGLAKNFDFISTGGGAMLEFFAHGTLPGIEAIKKSRRR